ncbi:MAG: homoserine O-acetyltransferase [Bacteroidales bacterium]|nr:homoserine O-acetyltransferase [Bacteroidales bacterium]
MISHKLHTAETFSFEAGGSLPGITIEYRTSEREYRKGDKVIWICHALTANSDPEDWWSDLTGPGKFFDTEKYFVVCVNMLTSPYGSSGPASINPETGKPYFLDFPKVTVRDIVKTEILVREHLGIEKVDLLIGGSIGGFQALEWTVMEPDVIQRAVYVATSARVTPWVTAGLECQRMAIRADHSFEECKDLKGGEAGLRCARGQALISYRSFEGYCLTQPETDDDVIFADRAASYERYQGLKITKRNFDAYSYYYLTYAVDSHNVGRNRGGVAAALSQIKAKTKVIAIDSDCLFPIVDQKTFADMIPGCEYHVMTSAFGHDGFLLEYPQLREILAPVLESL